MNAWLLCATVLVVALLPCLVVCLLAGETAALAAVEVAATLLVTVLLLLAQGTHRQPFVDLALTFAIMSVIGSIAFARMMEKAI